MRRREGTSHAAARTDVDAWLPTRALRPAVLTRLAESIRVANAAAPLSRGLTSNAKAHRMRLNVGRGEAFLIVPEGASHLFVDRVALRAVPPWQVGADGYKFVPTSIGFSVPVEERDALKAAFRYLIG